MVEEEKKTKPLGPVVWLLPLVVGLGLVGVYFGAVVPSDKTPNPTINPTVVESSEIVVAKPKEPELLMVEEVEQVEEKAEMLVLTPEQLAQANEMLAAFEGKPLNELVQVYGVMNMAATSVSPEDRPIFEFVLAKLGVHIAELEQQKP